MNCLRLGKRFQVEFPVQVQWKTRPGKVRQLRGEVLTMSANGVFMRLPCRLRPNTRLTLTVSFPTEVTKTPLKLRCQARVVSMKNAQSLPYGVAAIIDDYQFLGADRRA